MNERILAEDALRDRRVSSELNGRRPAQVIGNKRRCFSKLYYPTTVP